MLYVVIKLIVQVHIISLDIAWNNINVFRKIFNAFWRDSIRPLLLYCLCLPSSVLLPIYEG